MKLLICNCRPDRGSASSCGKNTTCRNTIVKHKQSRAATPKSLQQKQSTVLQNRMMWHFGEVQKLPTVSEKADSDAKGFVAQLLGKLSINVTTQCTGKACSVIWKHIQSNATKEVDTKVGPPCAKRFNCNLRALWKQSPINSWTQCKVLCVKESTFKTGESIKICEMVDQTEHCQMPPFQQLEHLNSWCLVRRTGRTTVKWFFSICSVQKMFRNSKTKSCRSGLFAAWHTRFSVTTKQFQFDCQWVHHPCIWTVLLTVMNGWCWSSNQQRRLLMLDLLNCMKSWGHWLQACFAFGVVPMQPMKWCSRLWQKEKKKLKIFQEESVFVFLGDRAPLPVCFHMLQARLVNQHPANIGQSTVKWSWETASEHCHKHSTQAS